MDYVGPPSLSLADVKGPDDIKEYVRVYQSPFPDLVYEIEQVSRAHGKLRVRWRATGTHESELFDMEPSGEAFSVRGINVFVVEANEITSIDSQWDTLKLVQEPGVVPPVGLIAE